MGRAAFLRLFMSSMTARVVAGSGEVSGRTLYLAAAHPLRWVWLFLACVRAGCRGEAWLKKGLPGSK